MIWKPHVTVAAIVERDGRFLMVDEQVGGARVLNQPAGHLEEGESLVDAVIRETLEETAWTFFPTGISGLYRWRTPSGRTYLRICFFGECGQHHPEAPLDEGIVEALWLTRDELVAQTDRLRSPMVLRCIDDYLAGRRYPLDLLRDLGDEAQD